MTNGGSRVSIKLSRDNITTCHMEEGGCIKSSKKCHILFEWPLCLKSKKGEDTICCISVEFSFRARQGRQLRRILPRRHYSSRRISDVSFSTFEIIKLLSGFVLLSF